MSEAAASGAGVDRDNPGQAALAKIDQVMAARPHKDDFVLSDTTENLCLLRDRLIGEVRAAGAGERERTRLEHVNAVISVVLSTHFPLGETPWDELVKARAWLADLLD